MGDFFLLYILISYSERKMIPQCACAEKEMCSELADIQVFVSLWQSQSLVGKARKVTIASNCKLDYHFLNNNKLKKKLLNAYHAYIRVTDDNKYLLVKFKMICISSKQAINMAALVFSTNATIDNENRNVKPKSQNNDKWKSRQLR